MKKLYEAARRLNRLLFRLTGDRVPGREEAEQNLKLLGENAEDYYAQKTLQMAGILLAGIGMTVLALLISSGDKSLKDGYFLQRKEEAYEVELQLKAENEEETQIKVSVEPQRLTEEESRELLEQVKEQMETYILGDNPSLEEVRSDLELPGQIEGTPVTLTWSLDSYEVMNLDGSIRTENTKEEGSIVELTAVLQCYEEEDICRLYAQVFPPLLSEKESFRQALEGELDYLQEESGETQQRELPAVVQGKTLIWEEKSSGIGLVMLLLTLATVVVLYMARDRELKQKTEERKTQMQRDYVRIVSKLVLLMGAGATIRSAWELIVRDYIQKREAGTEAFRYAYEEMALTCHEMQNGVAESKAYENFGLRCQVPCYLKLSALLEQNLAKGSRGLSQLLGAEIQEAFEQRKELARCQGEEASTRLLLPMILMLVVVIVIIIVPAGMSMQIS